MPGARNGLHEGAGAGISRSALRDRRYAKIGKEIPLMKTAQILKNLSGGGYLHALLGRSTGCNEVRMKS